MTCPRHGPRRREGSGSARDAVGSGWPVVLTVLPGSRSEAAEVRREARG